MSVGKIFVTEVFVGHFISLYIKEKLFLSAQTIQKVLKLV